MKKHICESCGRFNYRHQLVDNFLTLLKLSQTVDSHSILVHSFSSANQYVAMRSSRFPVRKLDSQLAIKCKCIYYTSTKEITLGVLSRANMICISVSSCVKRSPLLWNPVGVDGDGLGARYT